MTLTLIILGIIIGGILTLLSLVFMIISLINSKSKNAIIWAVLFVVSLGVVIYSVVQMVYGVADKVETGIEWVKEHGNDMTISTYNDEDRKSQRQNWLDTLQVYNMDKYDGKVPPDFYINKPAKKDANGLITIPFIYPYSIRFNNVSNTGDLIMEDADSVFVGNISQIAFDNNFALVKVDNSQSPDLLKKNLPETEYLLYDMRTRNFEPAKNLEMLLDLGRRIGYTGPTQLSYLSEDYKGWIEYGDYD